MGVLGVGAVLPLVGGGIFAFLAKAADSDLDDMKAGGHKLKEIRDQHETAESRALVANVLFGVGAVGIVAGGVLALMAGSPEEVAAQRIRLGPGGLEVAW